MRVINKHIIVLIILVIVLFHISCNSNKKNLVNINSYVGLIEELLADNEQLQNDMKRMEKVLLGIELLMADIEKSITKESSLISLHSESIFNLTKILDKFDGEVEILNSIVLDRLT